MRTLVTGATGFIGRRLLGHLENPVVLSRNADRAKETLKAALPKVEVDAFDWDPQSGPPPAEAFEGVAKVIHLAGEPVGEGRWTAQKKIRLRESRVAGTRHLVQRLAELDAKPQVLVSASAVGYYGDRGDETLTEESSPGDDFLAEICIAWEEGSHQAKDLGIRVVNPRIGVVLEKQSLALAKMLPIFKFGLGGPLGSGKQWMPWIHLDDIVALLLFVANNDTIAGPVNGVAPKAATNKEFTKAMSTALRRPAFLPVPKFGLRLAVGEFSEVLLASQRILPQAAEQAGFKFQYPDIESALAAIFGR